jgi:aspartyl-tRNA(Asn)/glutamyl-tRNA(Gln) amidotransferase subunit A
LGTLNMSEFAGGPTGHNIHHGHCARAFNPLYIAGGSSSGSGVAVGAGLVFGALGTDTGGSIRMPASANGVLGLKPTYGRVSRWGLVAFASSLDQVGPFTTSVADAAELLQVIAGADPRDATCLKAPVPDYRAALEQPIKGLRVGIVRECFSADGLAPEVAAAVMAAAETLQALGCELVDVSCPRFNDGIATYYVIAPSEASANLARYDGVKYGYRSSSSDAAGDSLAQMTARSRAEGFGDEVQRRILIGTYALSAGYVDAYYKKAQQVRTLIRRDFDAAFQGVDVLLTPTSPTTAFAFGAHAEDPLAMYLADLLTIPANMAGLPAISLPCGFDGQGLPIGLQLITGVLQEPRLLQVAHHYEQAAQVMASRPAAPLVP